MKKSKILFIHNGLTTFVKIDRELLVNSFDLTELYLKSKLEVNPFEVWKKTKETDIVVAWFASWHSFLPILFARMQRKRSLLIAGGYDSANLPSIGYGNQTKWLPKVITNLTIRLASRIIANSNFTKLEIAEAASISKSKISVVYHGMPIPDSNTGVVKKNLALNVGNFTKENVKRKGIAAFLLTAKLCNNYNFIQVGKWKDNSVYDYIENEEVSAEIKGYVSEKELENLYDEAKFYIQPSLHEGFGMSVVEAMQHGAIPIVSNKGALPEVVGGHGIILNSLNPESIAEAINKFTDEEIAEKSRGSKSFALQNYTLKNREKGVLDIINAMNTKI